MIIVDKQMEREKIMKEEQRKLREGEVKNWWMKEKGEGVRKMI